MEAWRKDLYNSELYHHGILGMHWGIRRYQNKDGSLTDAGQKRLNKFNKKMNKLRSTQTNDDTITNSSEKLRLSNREVKREMKKAKDPKYISKLTDDEMLDRINRAELEKQYKNSLGIKEEKKTSSILKDSIKAFAPTAITLIGTNYINNKMQESSLKRKNEIQQAFDKINENRRLKNDIEQTIKKNLIQLDYNNRNNALQLDYNKQNSINQLNTQLRFNAMNNMNQKKIDYTSNSWNNELNKDFYNFKKKTDYKYDKKRYDNGMTKNKNK